MDAISLGEIDIERQADGSLMIRINDDNRTLRLLSRADALNLCGWLSRGFVDNSRRPIEEDVRTVLQSEGSPASESELTEGDRAKVAETLERIRRRQAEDGVRPQEANDGA